jgi:hypothetical protein
MRIKLSHVTSVVAAGAAAVAIAAAPTAAAAEPATASPAVSTTASTSAAAHVTPAGFHGGGFHGGGSGHGVDRGGWNPWGWARGSGADTRNSVAATPSQSDGVAVALHGELRLTGDVVEHVGVRAGSPGFASVEGGDRVHIGAAKLDVEQLEVGPHAIGRH